MALTTLENIRNEGNLPGDLPDPKLQPHLEGAETRLRSLLGDTLYETVENEDENESRKKELTRAESMIALSLAIPVLNIRSGPKGGIVRGTGFGDGRNDFISIEDAQRLADYFYEKAMELVSKYLPDYDNADSDDDVTIIEGGAADWIAI